MIKFMKLFFLDLDGTLLTTDKKISPATFNALKNFAAHGNRFVICTGRDLQSSKSVCNSLNLTFSGTIIASFNGGLIYDLENNKILKRIGIPFDTVKKVLEIANEYHIYVHTYNDNYIVSNSYSDEMTFYRRAIRTPAIITDNIMNELTYEPCKLIAIELHDFNKLEEFRIALSKNFSSALNVIYSNKNYLEIIPKLSGKGNAVKSLAEILNIPLYDTIAAGDEENDISMIKTANLGIAMINGKESVKKSADVITKNDNDHDGLVPFFRI